MKKLFVLFCIVGLIPIFSCKKDKADSSFDKKAFVEEIFKAGMMWNTQTKALKEYYPINIPVDNTVSSIEGGNIHVLGSVTGTMNLDDQTNSILGGTMLIGLTETINDYAFKSNGEIYVVNGAPYISLAGTFTLQPGGITFGTTSNMVIGGGFRVTGPSYDKTINMQITININSNGTGGTVSGSIDGEGVYYKI
ncbi:MAG: hypothetical protein M0R21_10875 [Lentimicrobiaceae bacterium]|nr:hypothetical protein [Lentimicrobiaceae bacterium]